jgi:uncharacterized protein YgiM (DUF1202 family)
MKLQETIRPRYGQRELKKGNKLTMKQATKRIVESLVVVSLAVTMYYSSVNQPEETDYSTTAGVFNVINDYQVSYSTTAGVFNATGNMINTTTKDREDNNQVPVGAPLEDAEMNEEGQVVNSEFEPYVMYVTPSFLNVRSTPSTEEENVIGKLNINDEILIIGEYGDEWSIIDYNGTTAYISSEFIQDTLPEEDTYNYEWTGEKLNRHDGTANGPSGKETYYNLNMSRCIYYMQQLGYYEKYWVRSDGVKMYGKYVMVAADLNQHPKGSLIETSLGTGIVVDTGEFTTNGSGVALDIAVTWK